MDEIYVTMLGDFQLKFNGVVIDETFKSSNKIWKLLEYLVYFKGRPSTEEEIIELLWPNGDNKNPINALKNILFRLRNILEEAGIPRSMKLILYNNATISWNCEYPISTDYEEFESLYKVAMAALIDKQEAREAALDAIDLYKGGFLNNRGTEPWVLPLNTYYSSLYAKLMYKLIDILESQKDYYKMLEVCSVGVGILPTEEKLHYGMILAHTMLGNTGAALKQYNHAREYFRDTMDDELSEQSQILYKLIVESIGKYETNIDVIKRDLSSVQIDTGCLECPFEVFKSIYILHMRDKQRSGKTGVLLLFTLPSGIDDKKLESGAINIEELNNSPAIKNRQQGINILRETIKSNLRTGDVMTRYSTNQYLVLVMNIHQDKDISRVLNRIAKKTNTKLRRLGIKVETDFSKL